MIHTVTVTNRSGAVVASTKAHTLDVVAKLVARHRVRDGNRVTVRPELNRFERPKVEAMIERMLER